MYSNMYMHISDITNNQKHCFDIQIQCLCRSKVLVSLVAFGARTVNVNISCSDPLTSGRTLSGIEFP